MIAIGGLGALSGSRLAGMNDLLLPGQAREIAEQWFFGRSTRDDVEALADTAAGDGIRYAAAFRQAALEQLFAAMVSGIHSATLDDSQSVATEDVLIEDPECQAIHAILRQKIERLRFDSATLAIFETEMRSWIRASVEAILAGPVLQWRILLAAKFAEVALLAHETVLTDVLRDVPSEHPTCTNILTLSRLRFAQERFS
jgi:hypothetical protein